MKKNCVYFCKKKAVEVEDTTPEAPQEKYPDWNFVGTYVSERQPVASDKFSVAFLKMVSDCKENQIDLVVTRSISTFSRNTMLTMKMARMLKELDIVVYFEKENIYFSDMNSPINLFDCVVK